MALRKIQAVQTGMLQRYLWKLIPKAQRSFLLGRLSVVDRQVVNKVMSGNVIFPRPFADQNCLFIHVPKCAGSSLCKALFDDWRPGHLPLYWYEQQFPEAFEQSFKFTFVRHPLERAYSAFAFLKGNEPIARDLSAWRLMSRYDNFNTFVAQWLHEDNIRRQIHFAPQTDFLTDSLGRLAMDFIGRQESLEEDFARLTDILDLSATLPHINPSRQREAGPAHAFCTARTRRLIRRVYARDFELLGYA